MSYRAGDYFIAERTPPAECELCHGFRELRPYGPKGEYICTTCGAKDPEATKRAIVRSMLGAKAVVLVDPDL